MNSAHILSFAAPKPQEPSSSWLGSGTASNTSLFRPSVNQNQASLTTDDIAKSTSHESRNYSNILSRDNIMVSNEDCHNEKEQLEDRLCAQRHLIKKEIINIVSKGKTDKLYCEVYSMVLLLCLHKRSEQSKLWDFTNEAIARAIDEQIRPELQLCLSGLVESHAMGNTGSSDLFCSDETFSGLLNSDNTNILPQNGQQMSWVDAARGVHRVLDKFISRISLLGTILGTHVASNRKRLRPFKTVNETHLNKLINSVKINGAPVSIPLELIAKDAIAFFLDNIDDIDFESLLNAHDTPLRISERGENSTDALKGFFIEVKEKSQIMKENQTDEVSGRSIFHILTDVRSFFVLFGKFGQDSKIYLSLNECLSVLLPLIFTKVQRPLRKDPKTYVRYTYLRIVKVYQFLIFIGCNDELCSSIVWSITWRHLLQSLSEELPESLPDLVTQINRHVLRSLETVLINSEARFAANSLQNLLHAWITFVQTKTLENWNTSDPLQTILELKKEMNEIAIESFSNVSFVKEISSAMRKVLGQRGISSSFMQQLARFCDNGIRRMSRNPKSLTFIADALLMVDLVTDKDGFADIYARDLSRRLLNSKTMNFFVEQELVEGIIALVGVTECTERLAEMVKDYQYSRDQYHRLNFGISAFPQMEFSAIVLEKKLWSDVPSIRQELKIPPGFSTYLSEFEAFYKNEGGKKESHVFDWSNYMLHQLTLNVNFINGSKDLVVNMYQAAVLLAFQNTEVLEVNQLIQITGLTEAFLLKVLNSLSHTRYPILLVYDHKVSFNSLFSDKASKIKVLMLKDKENILTENKLGSLISQSNKLEAASVWELKARRTVPYLVFLATILQKFPLIGVSEIKRVIEKLIDNGYVTRSDDRNELHYVP